MKNKQHTRDGLIKLLIENDPRLNKKTKKSKIKKWKKKKCKEIDSLTRRCEEAHKYHQLTLFFRFVLQLVIRDDQQH